MHRQEDRDPTPIADALHRAMRARRLSAREVTRGMPGQQYATTYKILAGTSRDPRTSTLLALCRAIEVDPDEMLDAYRPALEPEAEALLDEAEALDEQDRELLVVLVRAVARRRSSP